MVGQHPGDEHKIARVNSGQRMRMRSTIIAARAASSSMAIAGPRYVNLRTTGRFGAPRTITVVRPCANATASVTGVVRRGATGGGTGEGEARHREQRHE